MKILYVTSEANPFAASGGLGDVMGALPAAVSAMGHECEVILPLYNTMKPEHREKLELVLDMSFNHSWRHTGASVYKTVHNNVTYYFVENHYYFDRGRLYGEFDDAERFAFFSRSVVEFMLHSGNIPDILHANDWQTAPAIIYLKTEYAHIELLSKVKTVYTIHNIEYQGKFGSHILGDVFGIDSRYRGILDFDGCINLMKGAIISSDFITTVSPNYARELEHDFFAFGLSNIIKDSRHKMCGVINGIDYGYFSPEKGGDIYASYNNRTYKSGKAKNKAALQAEVGLPVEADTPLVVMITRFASQKGIDLVLHIMDELLCENVQVIVLGTGEKEYEDAFRAMELRHPNF
ncbi:MAG: glycogen synthase [Clostridia bacterium]|nr:glycogen synthase [Clostridia bacterium]